MRHRGGGARKLYRLVDFGEEHLDVKGRVRAIEYDPNRNAFIALVGYEDGNKGYILASQGLSVGDEVQCAERAEPKPGNRMKLAFVPVGIPVHNIELEPGKGGKLVRGAGTAARITAQEENTTLLQLPSKEIRRVPSAVFVSVGEVSNPEHRFQKAKKAGNTRWKGRRPHVRGSAMNPVDHPHGGGEGKAPIGMKYPKTPWGKPARGVRTRKKKWSDKLILQRRKK